MRERCYLLRAVGTLPLPLSLPSGQHRHGCLARRDVVKSHDADERAEEQCYAEQEAVGLGELDDCMERSSLERREESGCATKLPIGLDVSIDRG